MIRWVASGSLALGLVLGSGCSQAPEDLFGYRVRPPAGWRAVEPGRFTVPGRAVEAWTSPDGDASLVVFRQIPAVGPVQSLLTTTVNSMISLPDLEVRQQKLTAVAGRPAVWLSLVAPGSGAALAPTPTGKPLAPADGRPLVPTHRDWLAIPRADDVLVICCHYPESRAGRLRPTVEAIVGSLQVRR